MNHKKTKTMIISKKKVKPKFNIKINGNNIQQVDKFIYLGQIINEEVNCDTEILRRIEIARSAFSKLNNILTKRTLSITTRKRLLICYVWSTLLYGAETWTVTKFSIKRLEAFEMWTYRKLLKIPWTMKLSNNHVLDKMNSKRSLIYTIKNKKLKYFGHLIRHSKLHRMLLEGQANGRRAKGRPRMSYINNIKQWTGLSHIEAIRSAQDRLLWRTIASNPCAEDGT